MDGRQHGFAAGHRLFAGEPSEYRKAPAAQALQNGADVSLGDARICGDSALENRDVQHPVRPAESVDGQAGAYGGQVAFFRRVSLSELHGGQSVAGAALHDHDYGRSLAEHRQKLL